ncbi:MAG: efflux RND transporter permease subunit [Deltaproteobacteria bacterium]|nr:efflux RND transporter permease subunit [Deltaproteobacteria bacterium]
MIARIVEWSARNHFAVLSAVGLLFLGALWTLRQLPVDAIPDLSDTQVIVFSRWDRSPDAIEDQVTHPIVTALLGVPRVKVVRGLSDYGSSFVYVLFEDGTEIDWARSRIVERLDQILTALPDGVRTELGPDATSVGWVYQYALRDTSGRHDLAELRSLQDWLLRFHLQAVPGVAEVAAVGGFVKQFQVSVDPDALLAYDVPLARVLDAVRRGNRETGGRLLEIAGTDCMVRGRGTADSNEDIEKIVVAPRSQLGRPLLVEDLARVSLGPEARRGIADLDGMGDTVGAVVVMRQGENALDVIERIEVAIDEIEPSLPPGVEIIPVYDRAPLIRRALETLQRALTEEMLIVTLVILAFLWHLPSAIVPIVTIPVAIVLAFVPLYLSGVGINVMSLAGIAISIGVLVDGAIVEVENAYKRLQEWDASGRKGDFRAVRLAALQEVAPSVFFSLLVISVSFLPVFALEEQEGRMFEPLAWAKTWTMAIAAGLAITLDPALRMLFSRMDPVQFEPRIVCDLWNRLTVGRYRSEESHPVSRRLFQIYTPVCRFVLRHPKKVIATAAAITLSTVPIGLRLGSEFMPPLDEGTLLYMPSTLPGISVTEAQRVVNLQDRIIESFPEVASVFGKAGRFESSTDPAPLSMIETTIVLKPESEWRQKPRWYDDAPEWIKPPLRRLWPDRISTDELLAELDARLQLPGIPNNWTMPIRGRIDMLTTGIRTPIGVKILGPDLDGIQRIAEQLEPLLKTVPGTRSVVSERSTGGHYLDIVANRDALARYGLSVADVTEMVSSAIGGTNVSEVVRGRERVAIHVRYARDFRDAPRRLESILVPLESGGRVSLGELAEFHRIEGPSMIRNESGRLASFVLVDLESRDTGRWVREARAVVVDHLTVPAGYSLVWSGQYESLQRVRDRLTIVVPLVLAAIALLLYLNTRSAVKVGIVLLAVPFSLIGAIWLLYLLDYQLSIAVGIGMIALMGLDAETGVFMLLYLDLAHDARLKEGRLQTVEDLHESIVEGAVKRVRPKLMTVLAAMTGLLPLLWSLGSGADTMKRVAAPMVGGLATSFLLELLVYPALYLLWKSRELRRRS